MFFAKQGGDFKIKDAQENDNDRSHLSSQQTPQSVNNKAKRSSDRLQQQNKVLNQAALNALLSGNRNSSVERKKWQPGGNAHDLLDDDMAARLCRNLQKEGGVAENMFQKPPKFPPSQNPIQPNLSQQQKGNKKIGSSNALPSGKDSDMLSVMAQRLSKLEMLCNNQREEIKEKSNKINKLEEQISFYQKSDPENFKGEYEKLQVENKKLKLKINEMEVFLNQYGLKWRGYDKDEEKGNDQEVKKLKEQLSALTDPKYKYNLPKEIDINIMIKRIEDLNYIMEKEGVNQVVNENGIRQFKRMDPFPIGFYANGIALKGFKFFAYGSNQAYQILADILDGYFPYQLKKQFPNGTLLKIIDKTDQNYTTDKIAPKFGDLTGQNDNDNELKPQSKEEFLEKLPKQVIKNGQVIPVRDEIAKKFEANNQIQTKEVLDQQKQKEGKAKQFEHKMEDDRTYIPMTDEQKQFEANSLSEKMKDELCMLKIRTETGKFIILLRLFAEKNIQDIYDVVKYFSETDKFTIMDNSTRQVIPTDSKDSLMQLDFHPNAVLTLCAQK